MNAPGDDPPESVEASTQRRAERERLRSERAATELEIRRTALLRGVRRALVRTARKLSAIEGDAQRAEQVASLRRHASLVLSHLHELPRHCTEITLLDLGFDPPEPVALQFDPRLGPKRSADAWFIRARKLERGAAIAATRAVATRAELETLARIAAQLEALPNQADTDALAVAARELGVADDPDSSPGKKQQPTVRLPYREFSGSGNRPIWVGRGNLDNDRLTLDHAKPRDLWLHARGDAGAHVVVPLGRDEACPPDLLADAATLAAHFSKARGQSPVEVTYTARRYVRKPRGSAPGLVALIRESVFLLRVSPETLRRLLASERPRAR
jgi:predicted ribosome quality control (RQC) complex YloA/Tae2 family protein